ncbi:MAG: glycosyltransferase family 2 protein [Lachnospiraceae bacterium]|nr:glycosyltransferase family 2 protein [Lachnospiraceae bacterium]
MINIILSSYNGEKYITEQIESILDSDYQDFRLFVFDDASTDNTITLVKKFEDEYPDKVFLVRNSVNKGSTGNFLSGLKFAARTAPADYYAFCDQDDVWLENRLSLCLENMKSLEEEYTSYMPLMLFTDAVLVDSELNSLGTTFFKADRLNTDKLGFARILTENRCIGCTSFMNAALVNMIEGYDKRIRYHDWWAALIASAFGELEYVDVPTVLYRQHSDNVVGQKSFTGYVKDRFNEMSENNTVSQDCVNHKNEIKTRIRKTIAQASAFHKMYGDDLLGKNKVILREFIALGWADPVERRRLMLKNGFYKSGLLRNIGLFINI